MEHQEDQQVQWRHLWAILFGIHNIIKELFITISLLNYKEQKIMEQTHLSDDQLRRIPAIKPVAQPTI